MTTARRRFSKQEILDKTSVAFGTTPKWHSYVAVPNAHRFATYFEENISFSGADFFAQFKEYDLIISIFYRNEMLADDFKKELVFEDLMRPMGHFSKNCGYTDNKDKLYYTQYIFNLKEPIPTTEE